MGTEGEKKQMRLIVCDTGPILHLIEAKLLYLLNQLGKVYIPKMVDTEIDELVPLWNKRKPEWLQVVSLYPNEVKQAESLYLAGLLGLGEAEAIILAKRIKAKWFLTDDTEARIFANLLGLEVHGSLGIVLKSAAIGLLNYNEARNALKRLSKTSLWISEKILLEAYEAIEMMFNKKL